MNLPTNQSADGVKRCTLGAQPKGGGAIPASALYFHVGETKEAGGLIKQFHYSHRTAANVQFTGTLHLGGGLFGNKGIVVASITFSVPPTRWGEDVLELSRLVRHPKYKPPLTLLISLSCSRLRQQKKDLLVSFADQAEGHLGIVYQASGWTYNGLRARRMDGLLIDGVFVPGRTCNSIYGTQSPTKLKATNPHLDIVPHYDIGKHLYWKQLGRKGSHKAKRLGLKSLPYPKLMETL